MLLSFIVKIDDYPCKDHFVGSCFADLFGFVVPAQAGTQSNKGNAPPALRAADSQLAC
jgi:hypothetical protein